MGQNKTHVSDDNWKEHFTYGGDNDNEGGYGCCKKAMYTFSLHLLCPERDALVKFERMRTQKPLIQPQLRLRTVDVNVLLCQGKCGRCDAAHEQSKETGSEVQRHVVVLQGQHQHHRQQASALQVDPTAVHTQWSLPRRVLRIYRVLGKQSRLNMADVRGLFSHQRHGCTHDIAEQHELRSKSCGTEDGQQAT